MQLDVFKISHVTFANRNPKGCVYPALFTGSATCVVSDVNCETNEKHTLKSTSLKIYIIQSMFLIKLATKK